MFLERFNFQLCVSFLPEWISSYALAHLDTIPKLINHLLIAMAVCNVFFLFESLRMAFLPAMGFNVILISIMLCIQNTVVWVVLNHNLVNSRFHALSPNDFIIGVSLGITIGASILTFVVSVYFHRSSKCDVMPEVVSAYACERYGTVVGLWFWGVLLFWLNTATALLIAIGKDDLIYGSQSQYEDIGLSMDEYEDHFRRYNAQNPRPHQHLPSKNGNVYEQVGEDSSSNENFHSPTQQVSVTP